MSYKINDILKILVPEAEAAGNNFEIRYLVYDTRKIIFPEYTLFFALSGPRRDGHDFIACAYKEGVRAFVIKKDKTDRAGFPEAVFIETSDPLESLQRLAASHRAKFNIPVIGITGSNGKTILKEWLHHLLTPEYNVAKSPGSFNSQIGVALSVWQINEETEIAIFEAGISLPGEMERHQAVVNPTMGVFTNLGDAHSDGFISPVHKLREKIRLFRSCERIICCADDALVSESLIEAYGRERLLMWSMNGNSKAIFHLSEIENVHDGSVIKFVFEGKDGIFHIPFNDLVSVRLSIYSYMCAVLLGADLEVIRRKTPFLAYPRMRMEIEKGINNCTLINDSYNSDLESIRNALNYLKSLGKDRKTLILSDIVRENRENEPDPLVLQSMIMDCGIGKAILIGDEMAKIQELLPKEIRSYHYRQTEDFLSNIDNHIFLDETILLKGARKFRFEKIFKRLSESFHKTQLLIDFEALDHNINIYRSYLSSQTKIMAVIKASGYGAGAIKLAEHFEKAGIDYLSVAFLDEGIELRKAGIKLPIMIFNPDFDYLDEMIKYDLEPVVYSFYQFEIIEEAGSEHLKFHIKLDTGMRRLGFDSSESDVLCQWLKKHRESRVVSVFSHLAASNEPGKDDFTLRQVMDFDTSYEKIVKTINYRPLRHILNSSGIVRFPEYQYDMVRLGSGMHGVDTSQMISEKLEPVHILTTRISQIKILKTGEGMGYGLKGATDRERKIAIIPVGYADGLLRQAGNGRYQVWVNGSYAPVVADVNMDMSFIDITDIDSIQPGDMVEVFGKNARIEDLAKAGNTIFYEILSKISIRIRRIYTAE